LQAVLAAYAVGRILELTPGEIKQALESCRALHGDCQLHRLTDRTVIDATGNKGVVSILATLDALRESETVARRVIVCGQRNDADFDQHVRRIGQAMVATCGVDLLVACGHTGKQLIAAAQHAGLPPSCTVWCKSSETLSEVVSGLVQKDDVVLVNGQAGSVVQRLIGGVVESRPHAA
jgi:UDP-N-acetylmuramyl pentapeptide synthase